MYLIFSILSNYVGLNDPFIYCYFTDIDFLTNVNYIKKSKKDF